MALDRRRALASAARSKDDALDQGAKYSSDDDVARRPARPMSYDTAPRAAARSKTQHVHVPLSNQTAPADLHIEVHSVELEPVLMKRTERERLLLWLEVDVFGLHDEGLVAVSNRCRPVHAEVPLKIDQRFIAEPEMPLWKPLREALETVEEQDSDVYFVLRGSNEEGGAAGGGGVELGTAHVNLEQLQKRGHEPVHERLSVLDAQERKVASLVVSMRALEALRWVARGADDSCRLGVGVGLLELSAGGRERLGTASKQSVLVRVELPQGLPPLRTREVRLSEKRVDFGFYGDVEVAPGSAQQGALAAALASGEEEESSVEFVLLTAGVAGGERERELGSGSVALHTLLRDEGGEEEARLVLPLTAGARQAPLGTLEVSLKALKALLAAANFKGDTRSAPAQRGVPGLPLGAPAWTRAEAPRQLQHALQARPPASFALPPPTLSATGEHAGLTHRRAALEQRLREAQPRPAQRISNIGELLDDDR